MTHEHVLVLEDHAEQREQIRQILQEAGYSVQVAGTSAEAIAASRREDVDLVVADIFLPDVSGIDAFREIRQIHPDAAGIAVTGFSSWETAMEALHVGFVGFIVKPYLPEQLVASVVNALEQEKLRRENARLRALVPLYDLSRAFMGTVELNELLNHIITTTRQETKAEVVSLMLFDDDHRELRVAAASGLSDEVIEQQKHALGNGIAGRVAKTGEPIMINQGSPGDPGLRDAMGRPEILSALSLPLRSRGEVIGVLNLSRMRGGEPFAAGDLELATVLASQASISIEKARLFGRLEQFSEVSQQLASASDLEEASSIIVEAPIRLVHARGAALWLFESGVQATLVHAQGLEDLPPPTPNAKMAEEFTPQGEYGWITLPLQHGDKILGALTVCLRSPLRPTEDRLGALRTLAHVAGATIESHRLRSREVVAFREVDRTVRADLNMRQMLERMLDQMISVCQADSGGIFLWDSAHDRVEPMVAAGTVPNEDLARKAVHLGTVSIIPQPPEIPGLAVGAPMRIGRRVEGAVVLTRASRPGTFGSRQIDLLSTLTSSAALIVRNTQLYARSEEAAIAEERTRIAREIHDGLAQDLAFLVLKTSVAQKLLTRGDEKGLQKELREISEQLRLDAREVRRVIFALRPLDIEALGFLPALEKFTREFAQANDIQVHYQVQGDGSHLPPKLETALFRLTQEALNNVRRHARAKHTWINLAFLEEGRSRLSIRDDGCGFDVEKVLVMARLRGRVGLVQMRERAERAGGTFSIESTAGVGTCIQVELPIREL